MQNAFSILSAIGANKRLIERVKSAVPRAITTSVENGEASWAATQKTLHLSFVACSSVFRNSVNAVLYDEIKNEVEKILETQILRKIFLLKNYYSSISSP